LASLQTQYNEMRTQISELAEDSGYKGKNLLSATESLRTLAVKFEGNTLNVTGFNATAGGLGVTEAAWTGTAAQIATKISADIDLLDGALTTMRAKSSALAGNLSIISVRQNFSTDMINTLNAGSDLLTLADSNEEGANMLMLQTRQSLSTTALSLSAQAAQSVLKLFG
jgi:flagellin